MQVGNAWHYFVFTVNHRSLFRIRDDRFEIINRNPDRNSRSLVDLVGGTRFERDLRDDVFEELWHPEREGRIRRIVALLIHDRNFFFDAARVMSSDLNVKAVLKRGNDSTARGIVFGISAGKK